MAFYISKPGREDNVIIWEMIRKWDLLASDFVEKMEEGPTVSKKAEFIDKPFGDIISERRPGGTLPDIESTDIYGPTYMEHLYKLYFKDNERNSDRFHAEAKHVLPNQKQHKERLDSGDKDAGGFASKEVMHLVIATVIVNNCPEILKAVEQYCRAHVKAREMKEADRIHLDKATDDLAALQNQPIRDEDAISYAEGRVRDCGYTYRISREECDRKIMKCALKMDFDTVIGFSYYYQVDPETKENTLFTRVESSSVIVVMSTYFKDGEYKAGVLTAYPTRKFTAEGHTEMSIPPDVLGDFDYYYKVFKYIRTRPDSNVTRSMNQIAKAIASRHNFGVRSPPKKYVPHSNPVGAQSFEGSVVDAKIQKASNYEYLLERLPNNARPSERRAIQVAADYAHYLLQKERNINIRNGRDEMRILSSKITKQTDIAMLDNLLTEGCIKMQCVNQEPPEDEIALAHFAEEARKEALRKEQMQQLVDSWVPKEKTTSTSDENWDEEEENWDEDEGTENEGILAQFVNWLSSPFQQRKKDKKDKKHKKDKKDKDNASKSGKNTKQQATSPKSSTVFDTPPASPCKKE